MTDDGTLFACWREGDRAAGEVLIERHYDPIARFFATKAPDHADDLVQRTFLACAEAATRFRGDSTFRAFLFGIARNVLLEHIRQRVRGRSHEVPDLHTASIADLGPGVSTLAEGRAERRLLVLALQHVPVELQIVLELRYWEDLSIAELAVLLEVPEGTVKSRLHRARAELAQAMARVAQTPEERDSVAVMLSSFAGNAERDAG